MLDHPAQRGGTVVEAGRERVRAVLAAPVAELHADDDEARGRQLVAPVAVGRARRFEQHHAAAVQVQHARQVVALPGRSMDEDGDIVAVEALDHLDRPFDALDRGHLGRQGAEEGLEALLGHGHVLEEVVDR